jgi:hypothetical protein
MEEDLMKLPKTRLTAIFKTLVDKCEGRNGTCFVFALNARLMLLLFVVQVILSVVQLFIPTWMAAVNSLITFYLIPGIILISLFIAYSVSLIELLSLSIITSSLAIPVIVIVIGYFHHPLQYWHFASGILAFSFAIALAGIKLRTKTVSIVLEREHIVWFILVLVSTLGASGFLFFVPPHGVTPDENFHLNAAYTFLERDKIFSMGYDILSSMFSYMLTSRVIATIQFASFIASLPTWSITTVNLSSLFFLFGLLIVSSHLMYEVNGKDSKLLMAVPLVIALNPLLLMLSSYALTDLAVAFYGCVFSLFFVRSLASTNNGIRLNYLELFSALTVTFIIILIKFNLPLIIPAITIYLYFALKHKWYKIRVFKILLILFLIIISFFLLVDFYRYVLMFFFDMDKASIPVRLTYNILPFSFLDMIFSTEKVFSSLKPIDYLWVFNVVLSPQNLSLIGLSCLVLSAINSFVKNTNFALKSFTVLFWGAVAISYMHALSIGYDSWIVIRYYAFLIPLAVVLILSYIDRITSYFNILQVVTVSVIVLLGITFLMESYGRLPYSYLMISSKVGNISILMFHMLLLCAFLLLALLAQYRGSLQVIFFNRLIINLKITEKYFIQATCILLLVISNISFAASAFRYSPSYQYPELSYLPATISAGDFVISNYYGIGSYIRNNYLNAVWIMPPPKEEFGSLISSIPEGSKLLIFKGGFSTRTDKYIGDYFTKKVFFELNRFNVKGWKAHVTASTDSKEMLFSIYMFEGEENLNIIGLENPPIFNNISWDNYGYLKVPHFESRKNYIEIPYSEKFNVTPPFTIEVWVKPENLSTPPVDRPILDISVRSGGGFYLFLRNGVPWFVTGFGQNAISRLKVFEGMWNYIVVTYNGTHSIFFINGEKEVVNGPLFQKVPEGYSLLIGRSHWGGGATACFMGNIGWLALYRGQMQDNEVAERYGWAMSFNFQKTIGDLYEIYQVESGKAVGNYTKLPAVRYSWSVAPANATNIDEVYVILNIMLESEHEEFVTVVVSTETFSRVYTFWATSGNNSVTLKFKNNFNELQYGSIVARMSRLIVLDEEGRILLDDVIGIHVFSLLNALCYCLIISIALLTLLVDFKYSVCKKSRRI